LKHRHDTQGLSKIVETPLLYMIKRVRDMWGILFGAVLLAPLLCI